MTNNIIKCGTKSLAKADGENNLIQQLQVELYDAIKNCGKLGQYGIYGNAPSGSLVVVMQVNGQEEFLFGVEDDVNNRPRSLAEGEVMLYNTLTKNFVFLKQNGDTEIYAQNDLLLDVTNQSQVQIHSNSQVTIEGDSTVEIKGKSQVTIESDSSVEIKGDADVDVTGDASVDVTGNADIKTNNATINSSDVSLTCTNFNVTGKVNITGDTAIVGATNISGNTTITGSASITADCTVAGLLYGGTVRAGNGSTGTYTNGVQAKNGIVTAGY